MEHLWQLLKPHNDSTPSPNVLPESGLRSRSLVLEELQSPHDSINVVGGAVCVAILCWFAMQVYKKFCTLSNESQVLSV